MKPESEKIYAISLARISTQKQHLEGDTTEDQIRQCDIYIKKRGWEHYKSFPYIYSTVKQDKEYLHEIMGTEYADSTLITQSLVAKFGEAEVYLFLNQLLKAGKTRFVSLSNASPDFIRAFHKEFGDKFIAHEGHLSFEVRALQDKGVFETCDELGVTNIIWRPLRRNMTSGLSWPLLAELSEKYGKSQNQIVLNWITLLGYHPMVMSTNKAHIDENLASTEFQMSEEDYKRMTEFRPSNYNPPEVDWDKSGKGDSIVTLVTDFEKHIKPL